MGIGENLYDSVSHKEIVDTFFKKTSPVASPPSKKAKKKKPYLILFFAAFLLLAFLAASAIIFIGALNYGKSGLNDYGGARSAIESFIGSGAINRAYVKEARFDADAQDKSSFLKSSIRLVNQENLGRAAFLITLKDRTSLKDKSILITAKSESGLAYFKLLLKDEKGNYFTVKKVNLAPSWTREHIFIRPGKNTTFDFFGVSEMKIEFGSKTAGNNPGAVIYLKDLAVRGGS